MTRRSPATRHAPVSARLALFWAMSLDFAACASGVSVGVERSEVIGGMQAGLTDQPATGALVRSLRAGSAELICTGTLITPRAVLTAAHCMVLLGGEVPDFSLATASAAAYVGTVHAGLRAHVHPEFAIGTAEGLQHDIAILELAADVEGIAPAPLPAAADAASQLSSGSLVSLVGYGATGEDGTNEGVKNVGVASIVGFTAEEVVIGAPGLVRNCTGDSGGPSIAYTSSGRPWLLGITSRSWIDDAPCVGSAAHTRVDAHLPWIEDVLADLDERSDGCRVARTSRPRPAAWFLMLLGAAGARWRRGRRRGLAAAPPWHPRGIPAADQPRLNLSNVLEKSPLPKG